jgi:hypothetical protein
LETVKHLLPFILSATFVASIAQAEDRKFLGTFESVPFDVLVGLTGSGNEKLKESMEKTKQTLLITEKDMTLNVAFGGGGGIYMTYTTQGDFILGKTVLGTSEMYYPIYAKDADTLFLAGQKFVRKKAEAK